VEKKIKLAVYGDDPTKPTGFGRVIKGIMKGLKETDDYEIVIWGINSYGEPWEKNELDLVIWPASGMGQKEGDLFGRKPFLQWLMKDDTELDVLFVLNDLPLIGGRVDNQNPLRFIEAVSRIQRNKWEKSKNEGKSEPHTFRIVYYFPVDAQPVRDHVLAAAMVDVPVVYTDYGAKCIEKVDQVLRERLKIVPHGIDLDLFKPPTKKEKEDFVKEFGLGKLFENRFVILNSNRCSKRKDPGKTLLVYSLLRDKFPQVRLFFNTLIAGDSDGYNLLEVLESVNRELGIKFEDESLFCPHPRDLKRNGPLPDVKMKCLYGLSDVVFSSTYGEGWGFGATEAMACRKPVVAPNNTSHPEILGEDRGVLVDLSDELIFLPNDYNVVRKPIDVRDAVEKIGWLIQNPGELESIAEKGYQWIKGKGWDKVVPIWDEIIKKSLEGTPYCLTEEYKKRFGERMGIIGTIEAKKPTKRRRRELKRKPNRVNVNVERFDK
jgi:glycosyltransferase involved in cell wall biosynthesis